MKKTIVATLLSLAVSASAFASNMYLDVGAAYSGGTVDADTKTGIFDEFGFSQMWTTSIYDLSDGSVFGSFYDTNKPAELLAAGIAVGPANYTALDGGTVSLVHPICPGSVASGSQCDIDALSPLVPPLASDNEGFLNSWDLRVSYHFDGILTANGPIFTGGTFDIFFNDFADANDRLVLSGVLTSGNAQLTNLDLFFDVTFAEAGFLWVETFPGSGIYVDASTLPASDPATLVLDTNVDPPIPTADQLGITQAIVGPGGEIIPITVARQTRLDGSITANIPEPGSIALLGLGLLGLGYARRSASKSA